MNDSELLVVPAQPAPELQNAASTSRQPRVKAIDRSQTSWLVMDVEALIDQDHPARAIWDMTGRLPLDAFYQSIKRLRA